MCVTHKYVRMYMYVCHKYVHVQDVIFYDSFIFPHILKVLYTACYFHTLHTLHTIHTLHALHPTHSTPSALHTLHTLHPPHFTPSTLYTLHTLHPLHFTPSTLYTLTCLILYTVDRRFCQKLLNYFILERRTFALFF